MAYSYHRLLIRFSNRMFWYAIGTSSIYFYDSYGIIQYQWLTGTDRYVHLVVSPFAVSRSCQFLILHNDTWYRGKECFRSEPFIPNQMGLPLKWPSSGSKKSARRVHRSGHWIPLWASANDSVQIQNVHLYNLYVWQTYIQFNSQIPSCHFCGNLYLTH